MLSPILSSYVGGAWLRGEELVDDINPANPSEVVAKAGLAGPEETIRAVDAASEAFALWRRTTAPARGEILRRVGDLLDRRATAIAEDLTREEGKTLNEATTEVKRAASIFRYYAAQVFDPDGETLPSHSAATLLY